ncbi:hypothetical protein PAPYR_11307 [Paratrimastix pyriformis]|uniref:Uncharacterized protein n=1 Tax=Paratrimastix pyriformis TaxID=342808 RepID=A0ABQ8U406_9EUKA|nr:hypothetical protein PAPYR_11307 [Paratrimastix pyriformis]
MVSTRSSGRRSTYKPQFIPKQFEMQLPWIMICRRSDLKISHRRHHRTPQALVPSPAPPQPLIQIGLSQAYARHVRLLRFYLAYVQVMLGPKPCLALPHVARLASVVVTILRHLPPCAHAHLLPAALSDLTAPLHTSLHSLLHLLVFGQPSGNPPATPCDPEPLRTAFFHALLVLADLSPEEQAVGALARGGSSVSLCAANIICFLLSEGCLPTSRPPSGAQVAATSILGMLRQEGRVVVGGSEDTTGAVEVLEAVRTALCRPANAVQVCGGPGYCHGQCQPPHPPAALFGTILSRLATFACRCPGRTVERFPEIAFICVVVRSVIDVPSSRVGRFPEIAFIYSFSHRFTEIAFICVVVRSVINVPSSRVGRFPEVPQDCIHLWFVLSSICHFISRMGRFLGTSLLHPHPLSRSLGQALVKALLPHAPADSAGRLVGMLMDLAQSLQPPTPTAPLTIRQQVHLRQVAATVVRTLVEAEGCLSADLQRFAGRCVGGLYHLPHWFGRPSYTCVVSLVTTLLTSHFARILLLFQLRVATALTAPAQLTTSLTSTRNLLPGLPTTAAATTTAPCLWVLPVSLGALYLRMHTAAPLLAPVVTGLCGQGVMHCVRTVQRTVGAGEGACCEDTACALEALTCLGAPRVASLVPLADVVSVLQCLQSLLAQADTLAPALALPTTPTTSTSTRFYETRLVPHHSAASQQRRMRGWLLDRAIQATGAWLAVLVDRWARTGASEEVAALGDMLNEVAALGDMLNEVRGVGFGVGLISSPNVGRLMCNLHLSFTTVSLLEIIMGLSHNSFGPRLGLIVRGEMTNEQRPGITRPAFEIRSTVIEDGSLDTIVGYTSRNQFVSLEVQRIHGWTES